MVAGSLALSLLMTDLVSELDDRGLTQSTVALDVEDEGDATSHSAWGDERDEDALLNGDYRVILQLVGVVPQGVVAKRLLDRTIDRMDGVQNLRTAIRDYKLRAEAEAGSAKGRKAFSLGCACAFATRWIFLIPQTSSATARCCRSACGEGRSAELTAAGLSARPRERRGARRARTKLVPELAARPARDFARAQPAHARLVVAQCTTFAHAGRDL